jgi:hypothetical protein
VRQVGGLAVDEERNHDGNFTAPAVIPRRRVGAPVRPANRTSSFFLPARPNAEVAENGNPIMLDLRVRARYLE